MYGRTFEVRPCFCNDQNRSARSGNMARRNGENAKVKCLGILRISIFFVVKNG